jgi:hypothetical protein
MSFEGVSKRVEMSMSLTAANELVSWMSKSFDIQTLSKLAILFTVMLVFVEALCIPQKSTLVVEREGIIKILHITRQVSILVVARSVLYK